METSGIIFYYKHLKKNLTIDNEKLDPFSCQPVLSIVFYLGQDILQLKIVRNLSCTFILAG